MTLAKRIEDNLKKNGKTLSKEERESLRGMAASLKKTKNIYRLASVKAYEALGLL
jgi:hypothetical protein